MRFTAVVLTTLLFCNTVRADFIIDDFDPVPGGGADFIVDSLNSSYTRPLNDDVAGNLTITTPGTSFVRFTGGGGVQWRVRVGAPITFAYDFTAPQDFTIPQFQALRLNLFQSVSGFPASFEVSITDSGTVSSSSGPIAIGVGNAPYGLSTSGDFLGAANLTMISQLALTVSSTTGTANLNSQPSSITSNPEPASLLLLGLTGSAGGLVIRRRKKRNAALAAV